MKKISILIPTYNEKDNVKALSDSIIEIFEKKLSNYQFEIVFIDNFSIDGTRDQLRMLCGEEKRIKAIFNAKNFGWLRSPYHGMLQTTGDCTISMCADFQDPPELIPDLVTEWEKGHKVVCGVKVKSKESGFMYFIRTLFYRTIRKISEVDQIQHFTGFGLYDKSFMDILRTLDDPMPYIRGLVSELCGDISIVPYTQPLRQKGKSKSNFWNLYDVAMLGITSYSKVFLRFATFFGFVFSIISFVVAIVFLILKLVYWYNFPLGVAPTLIGIFFMGSIQLFFIGILGEYVLNINTRIMKRPLVVESERLNFDD